MKKNEKILLILVMFIVVTLSCNRNNLEPKVLNIAHYQLMANDPIDPITVVSLLHSYPKGNSNVSNTPTVNLYVCKKNNSKDSIFVFDINKPAGKVFFGDDYKGQGFIINRINIKDVKAHSVVINIPSGFIIPNKIEYVFARIDQTSD